MKQFFVPANLSCFFTLHPHPDPRWAGTCGMGFTVNKGLTVRTTQPNYGTISTTYNGRDCHIPPVDEICRMLHVHDVHIDMTSPFPLGAGFGMSGACTLGVAYSLMDYQTNHESSYPDLRSEDCLSESLTISARDERVPQQANLDSCGNKKHHSCYDKHLAILAHTAEAKHNTGLGDIINQYHGGMLLKTKSSAHFEATPIPIDQTTVHYRIFGPKDTATTLKDIDITKLTNAGEKALTTVQKQINTHSPVPLHTLFAISKQFCIDSNLLTSQHLIETIQSIEHRGGAATMILLGNAIMSTIPFEGSEILTIHN